MKNKQIVVWNNYNGSVRVFENIDSYVEYGKDGGYGYENGYNPWDDQIYCPEYGKDIFDLEPLDKGVDITIEIEEALREEFRKKVLDSKK